MIGAGPEFEEFGREVGTVEQGNGDGKETDWVGGVRAFTPVARSRRSEGNGGVRAGSVDEGGAKERKLWGWEDGGGDRWSVCEMEGQWCGVKGVFLESGG